MKLLTATNNKHKIKEFSEIFENTGIELVSPSSLGLHVEVVEDGDTFAENALKKAQGFRDASGMASVADDSGLVVYELGGAPGVYSARYGGEGLDDKGRTALLLENMKEINDRRAAFVCSIALVTTDGRVITAEGRCEGKICYSPSGENGFGYDPVFVPDGFDRTFAELSADEKNLISHRGRALAELQKKLIEEEIK